MESQLQDFGTFQWLHPRDSLSDRHLFNKCQQEVNCSKNTRNKLFSTNCGVPKDIWMVKISLGLDPLHSASEKNVHTVLSIKLGQKTTCISNCTRSWSQNKQWTKDGQRLDNTHTPACLGAALCNWTLNNVCLANIWNSATCLAFQKSIV